MKKTLVVLGIFVLVIGLGVGWFFFLRGREEGEVVVIPTPEAYMETEIGDRPFISLIPSSDGHWLTLRIAGIKEADSLEYELTYSGQGAIGGPFELDGSSSYEKKILLGTESSGHYTYHEGVETGTVKVRLDGGLGPRKFVSEFHLQEGDEELTSLDGRFSLEGQFSSGQFYVVMSTTGLPEEIEGVEVMAGPYGVFTSGKTILKNGVVGLTLDGREGEVRLYDDEEWAMVEDGKVNRVGVFILVSSEG